MYLKPHIRRETGYKFINPLTTTVAI